MDEQKRLQLLLLDEKDRQLIHRAEVGEKLQPTKITEFNRLAKKLARKQKKTDARWKASIHADNAKKKEYNKAVQQKMSKNLVNALKVSKANIPESALQYLVDGRDYSVPVYNPVSPSSEDSPADPPQRRSV